MAPRDLAPADADPRRRLPAVGKLCASPAAGPLIALHGQAAVAAALRALIAEARERPSERPASEAAWLARAADRLEAERGETLFPVINAAGVVIHTNLGRAPLATEAVAAMQAAAGYANLELSLDTGKRGSRGDHLGPLIAEATGGESGMAVNNGAGAVLLALAACADGAPVIVSRGELVEIGGGFRVPDVVAQSGSPMVEVGTTNRTHLRDYEAAVRAHPDARVILRTHPSNFRVTGFTSAPPLADLAAFAHASGLLLVEDLGGGALVDLTAHGVTGEPTVQASLAAGADLVLFSGDKLLGGPQAGVAAGRRDLVERMGRHPLARALRIDKLSLAALAATLRLYRPPNDPKQAIPVLRMLTEPAEAAAARARRLAALIEDVPGLSVGLEETLAYAGGGALPMQALASWAVNLRLDGASADDLARRLRTGAVAVLGRIERDRVLLDQRTVSDEHLPALAQAVRAAAVA